MDRLYDDSRRSAPLPRVTELDALRGIAALAVMLYHLTWYVAVMIPGTPRPPLAVWWGCYGVQVFFAISGFVILGTLERTTSLTRFAAARAWRLFPTYWLAMSATFVVATLFAPAALRVSAAAVVANLPMAQLWTGVPMVDGVYWSLNVEVAFYACIALVWRGGLNRRIEPVVALWLALKWLWWACPSLPGWLGLLLVVDHAPYFAVGLLAYRVHAGERRWTEQCPMLLAAFASVLVIDPLHAHWLFAGMIAVFLALATGHLRWIAQAPLLWLGRISYPLYLLHAVIGYTMIVRLEALGVPPAPATIATLVLVVLMAAGVERAVAWRPARSERRLMAATVR